MSLSDAVLAIADAMEEEAKDGECHISPRTIRSFARELRTAVKASAGSQLVNLALADSAGIGSHQAFIDAERAKIRDAKAKAGAEERNAEQMVECRGGGADGTLAEIASEMPVGAKCLVAGQVYKLCNDDGLYLEAETLVEVG